MRSLSLLVVIMLVFVFAFTCAAIAAAEPFALRPVDPLAAGVLSRALTRSATVRALVSTLESSDVIVHIETSWSMPAGIAGMTRFVASRGGHRYLRITLSSALSASARTAILGHELQHACEVAGSHADDAAGLRQLFERRGDRDGDYFETRTAAAIERLVRKELFSAARPLQAEPVAKFDH